MTKRLALFGVAVMTTLMALVVLWQFQTVVIYMIVSLMFAAVLHPLADRLVGRKVIVRVAWILLFIIALGTIGLLLFLSSKSAINEIQQLSQDLSMHDAWRLPLWLEGSTFLQALIAQLPPPSMLFEAITGSQGQFILPALLNFTQGIGGILTGIFAILFLSIYWWFNQIHFERLWLSLLPTDQRKQARGIWHTLESEIGAYIRGELILSLFTGLLLGLGYWLLGSPYPAFLALVGVLASLIPMVGPIFTVIPVVLVGLLSSGPLGMILSIYTVVVLVTLTIWVKPRLINNRWDSPILTIVLILALADAFGLIGILIGPPFSVVCQILWSRLVNNRTVIGAASRVSDLKKRQARLWVTIKAMDEPQIPLVVSSMEQLTQLIEKAEPVLHASINAKRQTTEPSKPFQSLQTFIAEDEPPVSIKNNRN